MGARYASGPRTTPVIAVFGGSSDTKRTDAADIGLVLELAQGIGRAIGEHHYILLTGGIEAEATTVKGKAITGANDAHDSQVELLAPWIGLAGVADGNNRHSPPRQDRRTTILELGLRSSTKPY